MGIKLRVNHPEGEGHTVEHDLDGPIISVGSDESATLCLRDAGIASEQAVIIMVDDALPLLINRAPGTKLNGESLAPEAQRPLANNDQIHIATYRIEFISNGTETSTAQPVDETPQPLQSFEQVLNKLRTEDDSFYFLLEGDTRLPIDGTNVERQLGWGPTRLLTFDAAQITAPCALVRKDWSGVLIEAAGSSCRITVNEELLAGSRRLRNRDRVELASPPKRSPANRTHLIFCEPASLTVLDLILGREDLPLPVTNDLLENPPDAAAMSPGSSAPSFTREYFGAFTLFELMLMACGTLTGAALIFLLLSQSS